MKFAVHTRSDLRVETYRFPPWTVILIALLALSLQGHLPLWFPAVEVLDLPLLVTVYFALNRRSQISGMLVGAAIGIAQDSLGHGPIGLFGADGERDRLLAGVALSGSTKIRCARRTGRR